MSKGVLEIEEKAAVRKAYQYTSLVSESLGNFSPEISEHLLRMSEVVVDPLKRGVACLRKIRLRP